MEIEYSIRPLVHIPWWRIRGHGAFEHEDDDENEDEF